jgi:hypothetical protein
MIIIYPTRLNLPRRAGGPYFKNGGTPLLVRLLLALSLLLALPTSAFAYSYGDPNKEEIAETYKEIAAKLEQTPPDWNGAHQAFLSRKQEIVQHFGEQPGKVLEANFAQKQKDLVLHNYKAVLVLNIDRRLDYAEKQFDDYAQAKLLLAKARGTLNVLSPYISASASNKAYAAFDKALNALGNPGLFGVGAVPADKSQFFQQTKLIRDTLKPFFPLKTQQPSAQAPAGQPAAKKPGGKPSAAQSPKPSAGTSKAVSPGQPQAQAGSPMTGKAAPPAGTAEKPPATVPNGNDTSVSAPATAPSADSRAASNPVPAVSEQTDADAQQESTAAQSDGSARPDPEKPVQSKVNPLITASVVGGLLLVVGTSFWFAKRKGLF